MNPAKHFSRKDFLRGLAAATALVAARQARAAEAAKPGLTAEVADFVVRTRAADLPPALVELGKKHMLDAFGLALAGERAESGPLVQRYVRDLGVTGSGATIIGTALRATPRFAAFANGVAIHADDFDDTQLAVAPDRVYGLLTHPSVGVLPAAFAAAETLGSSGRDFMAAYHAGVEVETKIAEAIAPRSYESGFHSTPMCDVFGATAAVAKLRNFDLKTLRNAFGIAAAEAGGLRENFGTMTKPFQAGHGAETGFTAADMAVLGWTAADNILEAQRGFFAAFGGGYDAKAISGKLGQPWTLLSPGVSIKPYPSGSLSHPAMDEMRELIRAHKLTPDNVAEIHVGANHAMLDALLHHQPTTGLQGKFSMEFCMAVLLLDGKAGLSQFTDASVQRPAIQALIRKVSFTNDPRSDAAGADKMRSLVEVKMKDGKMVGGQMDFARGSPQKPMTFADVTEKFRGCCEYAKLPDAKATRIVALVTDLERVDNVRTAFDGLFTP